MSSTIAANSTNPFFDFVADETASAANVQTATLADGDIVVTWQETGASSGETAIEAEILNPDGSIAAPAFQVSTTTSGNQVDPAVAALASGGFVIVWQDGNDQSTGLVSDAGQDILDQVFTATGAEAGSETVVNVTTGGYLTQPSVAALSNGGYAVEFVDTANFPYPPEVAVDLFASGGTRVGGEQEIAAPGTDLLSDYEVYYRGVSLIAGQGGTFSLLADLEPIDGLQDLAVYELASLGFSAAGVPAANWQYPDIFAEIDNPYGTPTLGPYATAQTAGGETAIAVEVAESDLEQDWFQPEMKVYVGGEFFASIPLTETAPATSVALLGLANSDLVLAWTDAQGLHTGVFFAGSYTFTPVTYVGGAAPASASSVQLSALPDGFLETWVDASGSVESQIFSIGQAPTSAFNASAAVGATGASGTAVTITGTASDSASAIVSVALYNGAMDAADFLGSATLGAGGTWSLTTTLKPGTYDAIEAVVTSAAGVSAEATAPFTLQSGDVGSRYAAEQTTYASGLPQVRYLYFSDGSDYLTDTWTYNANGSYQVVYDVDTGAPYSSYTVQYSAAGKATSASFANGMTATWTYNSDGSHQIAYAGVTGAAYTSYTVEYGSNGEPTSASYSNGMTETWTYNSDGSYQIAYAGVTGAAYTSYTVEYGSNGEPTSASYSNGMTETWTYDSDGSYQIAYAGVTGAAYTSYTVEYGSDGEPASASYSNGMTATWTYSSDGSYEIAYAGVTGEAYTSYTIQYGSNGEPASASYSNGVTESWTYGSDGSYQIAYAGVTGEAYTSYTIQYGSNGEPTSASFSNGVTESWSYNSNGALSQIASANVPDASYTTETVQYSDSKPQSATFSDGMTETWTYNSDGSYELAYTGVQGESYTAVVRTFDASGGLETNLTTNDDGTHTLTGYQNGLTLTATASNETLIGGGNDETFVFNLPFGHDVLADFSAHLAAPNPDVLSLPGAPFSDSFTLLMAATSFTSSGATIAVDASDTISIPGLTQAAMAGHSGDFEFHG